MGSVVFKWQESSSKLLLMQFKEGRVIKAATWWDEDDKTKDIIGERDERTGRTLFACSKRGRVACLVNTNDLSPPSFGNDEAMMLPVKFLKGEMSPEDFANDLKNKKDLCPYLTFYLLVADLSLSSMFYISKKFMSKEIDEIRVVSSGRHILFDTGLDDNAHNSHNYQRLRDMVNEIRHEDDKYNEIVDELLKGDQVIVHISEEEECEKTDHEQELGSTYVNVEPTGEATFFELSIVNGIEKENTIEFNMDLNG